MMKYTVCSMLLSILAVFPGVVSAFAPIAGNNPLALSQLSLSSATTALQMAPRFDGATQKWLPASDEESVTANYPLIRSLLRHGPKAFLTRVTNPDTYDQAVLKFMAGENVERWEAQGNMDRFNENAQDWIFERIESQKTGRKLDYVKLEPKQVVLSSVWAGVVFWFINDFFERYAF